MKREERKRRKSEDFRGIRLRTGTGRKEEYVLGVLPYPLLANAAAPPRLREAYLPTGSPDFLLLITSVFRGAAVIQSVQDRLC